MTHPNAILQAKSLVGVNPKARFKPWTAFEDEVLFNHHLECVPLLVTAITLGRTYNSVTSRRNQLGYTREYVRKTNDHRES